MKADLGAGRPDFEGVKREEEELLSPDPRDPPGMRPDLMVRAGHGRREREKWSAHRLKRQDTTPKLKW